MPDNHLMTSLFIAITNSCQRTKTRCNNYRLMRLLIAANCDWHYCGFVALLWSLEILRKFVRGIHTCLRIVACNRQCISTDVIDWKIIHGLRTPNEAFFHWNPELLGLGRQIRQKILGYLGYFRPNVSGPILVQWVLSIIQPLFLQKTKPLYPHPKYFLGLGFEFGRQRIRDLAFVCP